MLPMKLSENVIQSIHYQCELFYLIYVFIFNVIFLVTPTFWHSATLWLHASKDTPHLSFVICMVCMHFHH